MDTKSLDIIEEFQKISIRMKEILSSHDKESFIKKRSEYEKVISSQLSMLYTFFAEKFISLIHFNYDSHRSIEDYKIEIIVEKIYAASIDNVFDMPSHKLSFFDKQNFNKNVDQKVLVNLRLDVCKVQETLDLKDYDFRRVNRIFHERIKPFMKRGDEKLLKSQLKKSLSLEFYSDLPF